MQKPTVTIIVTVYNIEQYLDRFFENLNQQSVQDFEVLIIEDGSQDNSLAVCRKYAAKDSRIRIVPVEHIGISAARNIALDQIDTEFVTSLDGDDIFDKDYLKHLLDAQKKYDADYVISNVIFLSEKHEELKRFFPRKEGFYSEEELFQIIPELLMEDRLNYLYGKLYRGALLKGIKVEEDVRQGSDTMINMQYCLKIRSLAVIEDYDYCNIKYISRSVTSYNGDDYFFRLYRINRYVRDLMEQNGKLDEKMLFATDGRVLDSGRISVNRIAYTKAPFEEKCASASKIIQSEEYRESYIRQEQKGNLGDYHFTLIVPGKEREYMRQRCDMIAQIKKEKKHDELRKHIPDFLLRVYHKIRNR